MKTRRINTEFSTSEAWLKPRRAIVVQHDNLWRATRRWLDVVSKRAQPRSQGPRPASERTLSTRLIVSNVDSFSHAIVEQQLNWTIKLDTTLARRLTRV